MWSVVKQFIRKVVKKNEKLTCFRLKLSPVKIVFKCINFPSVMSTKIVGKRNGEIYIYNNKDKIIQLRMVLNIVERLLETR